MRKLFIIASAFLLLTGCRKDEDELTSNELTGKWKMTKFVILDGRTNKQIRIENERCGEEIEFLNKNQWKIIEFDNEFCKRKNVWVGDYTYDPKTKILVLSNEEYLINAKTSNEMELEDLDNWDSNGDGIKDRFISYYQSM